VPVSSKDLIDALRRNGFTQSKGTGKAGTHRTFYRKRPGQTSLTVTVALDKKDIPTGTVAGMAKHCGMTLADFCTMLGIDL
jgi:predicted RNA binding protein YcfA (HicA-like mRNA interferase family)